MYKKNNYYLVSSLSSSLEAPYAVVQVCDFRDIQRPNLN